MLASRQSTISSIRRDAWVEVDLGAIEHNVETILSWIHSPTQLMAVVKSDGYGHGAVGIADVLLATGAKWLGVASVDEGCQIRQSDIAAPILILSPAPGWAVTTAIDNQLDLTVTSPLQVKDIAHEANKKGKTARVHMKVDTGMHRLGVAPDRALDLIDEISRQPNIKLVSTFSHLAMADDEATTKKQNEVFQAVVAKIQALPDSQRPDFFHLASGEATRRFPFTHHQMVRVGLYLYGLEPKAVSQVVRQAISVRARINHTNELDKGEAVGYNLTWTTDRKARLSMIPIGYADGVDRRLSNRIEGLLHGKRIKQVGLISMDQMLFDITDIPDAQEGDVITLIGNDGETLYLSEWATMLDTITYELACRLRVRLPRVYTRHRPDPGAAK